MIGAGKYDEFCKRVREDVGIVEGVAGGVAVIVFGGNRGNGFSVQCDLYTMLMLPDMLEFMAKQIREDMGDGKGL